MLFAASSSFGFYKAAALRNRQKRLSDICLFIEAATDRIRVGQDMKSIINLLGDKAGFYTEDYNLCVRQENLTESDIHLAEEFLRGLGMGDTQTELKRCEAYKELFKKELCSAETLFKEKGMLYGKLGVFMGLLVGIVLI